MGELPEVEGRGLGGDTPTSGRMATPALLAPPTTWLPKGADRGHWWAMG